MYFFQIVPRARVTRQDQKDRVKSEMSIQSRVNHRNILRMITYWEDSEKYCMALEFCEQKTLLSYIKTFPNKVCNTIIWLVSKSYVNFVLRWFLNKKLWP